MKAAGESRQETCACPQDLFLSIVSLFLKENLSLSTDYLKNIRILKDLSTVRCLNLGCVNIPPLFFFSPTHTQKAEEERILMKQI